MRNSATYAMASSCLVLTGLIALPNAIAQFHTLQTKFTDDKKFTTTSNQQQSDNTKSVPKMAAATGTLSNIGIWQIEPDNGNSRFTARLLGNNYLSNSSGFYRPELTLSCDSGRAKISFTAFEVLGTEHTNMTMQFDMQPGKSLEWNLHNNYEGAYITASKPLLNKLSRSEQLQINYRPFGSDEYRSVDFSLGASSDVTKKMKRQCA